MMRQSHSASSRRLLVDRLDATRSPRKVDSIALEFGFKLRSLPEPDGFSRLHASFVHSQSQMGFLECTLAPLFRCERGQRGLVAMLHHRDQLSYSWHSPCRPRMSD